MTTKSPANTTVSLWKWVWGPLWASQTKTNIDNDHNIGNAINQSEYFYGYTEEYAVQSVHKHIKYMAQCLVKVT